MKKEFGNVLNSSHGGDIVYNKKKEEVKFDFCSSDG